MNLDYAFQARLTDTVEIGPVDGGIRLDNYFDGRMTAGELAGARVRGIDQVRIRADGSVVLDIRETIETETGSISADVRGYAIPDPAAPNVHEIRGFALFSTSVPEYSDYNTAVVAIHGSVDMATRELEITGRSVSVAV
ncbi:MAG TPA: hypothetical protein VFM58_17740 [Solirubrobacteraceae bacterium]|jgi:hypothetical protein|nr:hypothetical protein [Solirubrobacteraceae bacterium]